jgi:hypothetical protein
MRTMGRWKIGKDGVMEYHPYSLVFYEREHKFFKQAYSISLEFNNLKKIFNKLRRHYKLNLQLVCNKRYNGACSYSNFFNYGTIFLPKNTSFGLLIHEIAHAVDKKKRGKTGHDKKFWNVIKRVNHYCEKNNYWISPIQRKL